MNQDKQAGLRPVGTNTLFPTMNSMQEVIDYAEAQLPITNKNTLMTILMVTQNTLLKVQEEGISAIPTTTTKPKIKE